MNSLIIFPDDKNLDSIHILQNLDRTKHKKL